MKIIIDSREKVDYWEFSYAGHEEITKGLLSGDYSIEGYETEIGLERKRSTGELANNLGSKIKQFRAELERLQSYKVKYVILEFSLEDLLGFPNNSGIPRKRWKYLRMSGKYMIKLIEELSDQYGIEFLYCNNKIEAEQTALQILESFYEEKLTHT